MKLFHGWWQVAVALLLNAASSTSVFTAYSIVAVPIQQAFEPSRTMLMMGVTVAVLAAGLLGPLLGSMIDRFSVKLMMASGTLLLGGGFVLLSFTTSMNQVLLVYFLVLSVGSVLTGPVASSALLARWFTRRRGIAISIAAAGAAVGGLFIPPVMQWLIEAFQWRAAMQIYGITLFVITAPIVLALVTNRPGDRGLYPDGDSEPPPQAAHGGGAGVATMKDIVCNRNFWLIALCLGMLLAGPMALVSNMLPFALEKGIDAAHGAVILSVFSAANFVGKLASGAIADRVNHRIMLAALLVISCLGSFGYIQAMSFATLAAVSAFVGAAQGAIVPLWSIMLAKIYGPASMGRSMGLMGLVIMPFTLVAAPLFGRIYDIAGSYNPALVGYMVLLLATLAAVALMRRERSTAGIASTA